MSFSDFAPRSSSTARPAPAPSSNGGRVAPGSSSSASSMPKDGLSNISETLLQYQRNVGILEKIVQSLTAKKIGTNIKELQAQYNAQVDVLAQLQVKIQRLLTQQQQQQQQQKRPTADSNTILTTLSKLQRDFDRIRQRVAALEDGVERFQKLQEQQKQNNSTAANQQNSMNGRAGGEAEQDYQQQIQLQLQQDRLHEEIMREREEEIRNINRGMHQVNEIYKDLAHIVGSQQEQIDTIENHMEESRVNAEAGLKQVEKANEKYGNGQCVIS